MQRGARSDCDENNAASPIVATLCDCVLLSRREDCTYNGNVAISRGGGYASCSGDGLTWAGSPNVTDSFISKQFCGGPVTGWYVVVFHAVSMITCCFVRASNGDGFQQD